MVWGPQAQMKLSKKAHDQTESPCWYCGDELDACSGLEHEHSPSPGDMTICIRCGSLSIFAEDLSMRQPSLEELDSIPEESRQQLRMAQRAVARLIESKLIEGRET